MTTRLTLDQLAKSYGPTLAVAPTSFAVAPGEFLTLLGPSGSGKTTLLMMIAGLTAPSAGRILLDGVDVTDRPPFLRDIGVVFQSYALFPHLTVAQNIAFPLEMRRRPAAQIRTAVAEALELVRLPGLGRRYPRELSGGQQQRVALARAIVFGPAVVLMDEPLGALDRKLREELKGEIRRLHRDLRTTIVYVTHDQDEAMLLSDRICLMKEARVAQIDTPDSLYELPGSRFAADFIGESNIVTGQVEGTRDGLAVLRLTGGERLATSHVARLPAAGSAEILIRPERVKIAGPAGPAALNRLPATIAAITNLGGTRRVVTRTAGGTEFKATLLSGEAGGIAVGQSVTLCVEAAAVVPLWAA